MILRENIKAQSTIEFSFAIIAVMFLIYGMVQIFRWEGMDLVNRRMMQDQSLIPSDSMGCSSANCEAWAELNSTAGDSFLPVAAVYNGSITNGNEANEQ